MYDVLYAEIFTLQIRHYIIFTDRKGRLCFQKRLSVILSTGGWADPLNADRGIAQTPLDADPLRGRPPGGSPPPR